MEYLIKCKERKSRNRTVKPTLVSLSPKIDLNLDFVKEIAIEELHFIGFLLIDHNNGRHILPLLGFSKNGKKTKEEMEGVQIDRQP